MKGKSALITGITGQDGSYMAELLLRKGYRVTGLVRPGAVEPLDNIRHLAGKLRFEEGDLLDQASLERAIQKTAPDEIYNLAAQSFVPLSWEKPVLTGDITGLGAARLLEATRRRAPRARFLQASSAEIFGAPQESPQKETTPLGAKNPYGAAKVYAHMLTGQYRAFHGLHASAAIFFNHESPRRGPEFVTRKVTRAAARIKLGLDRELRLGDLTARRDWGFAADYVEAAWLMLQQKTADDFVIATGKLHSVQDLVDAAFSAVDLDWREHVVRDESFVRREDAPAVVGDPAKAAKMLGWRPKLSFQGLIETMVKADLKAERSGVRKAAAV